MESEIPTRRPSSQRESLRANRRWWDAEADSYHAEHGDFLGDADFLWCPEGLRESDARLLGAVTGLRALEVGCGAASCARWLRTQGATVVASDLSAGMLRHAAAGCRDTGIQVPLVQCDVTALPFATESFDLVYTAFGAVGFVADTKTLHREIYRVLKPQGRWVYSVTHPMRWIFLDDPGEAGLVAVHSYFDRTPYVEVNSAGAATYVEHHRTIGDRIRDLVETGFALRDLIEPEWPEGHERAWGQWSPLRGRIFPGTAIFLAEKPS